MRTKIYEFECDGKTYSIPVTYKFQRGIYLRVHRDGFVASAPSLVSEAHVKKFIFESLPALIKRINKTKPKEEPIGADYTYLFGERVDRYIDEKELRHIALQYLTELTRDCEQEMGIGKPYKVRIRKMSSRFGSNSMRTHSISYQLQLIHFSKEIIRSVVVHELAHDAHRDHQSGFYKCVATYCPNYAELRRKLRKGIYQ